MEFRVKDTVCILLSGTCWIYCPTLTGPRSWCDLPLTWFCGVWTGSSPKSPRRQHWGWGWQLWCVKGFLYKMHDILWLLPYFISLNLLKLLCCSFSCCLWICLLKLFCCSFFHCLLILSLCLSLFLSLNLSLSYFLFACLSVSVSLGLSLSLPPSFSLCRHLPSLSLWCKLLGWLGIKKHVFTPVPSPPPPPHSLRSSL